MIRGSDQSDPARQLEHKVWVAMKAGDLRVAINACRKLNQKFPDSASGWHTASHLLLKLNNVSSAHQAIDRALTLQPDRIDWILQKGLLLSRSADKASLSKLLMSLDHSTCENAYHHATLAMLLTQLERRDEAVVHYTRASELEPAKAEHHYNIAILLRTLGKFDDAEASFDKAVALNPSDWEAWKVRSENRKQTAEQNHVREMEGLLNDGIEDERGKVNICFALAKELEDLGEWQRSFHYLKLGADTRRSYMRYDLGRDIATMKQIRECYNADLFKRQTDGFDNDEAVFIVGMPRTGTTLLERILGSHDDIWSAGELNNFTQVLMHRVQTEFAGQKPEREQLVSLTTQLNLKELGSAYINSTRPATGHSSRFIDKLPMNFLYAGLIGLALPGAKLFCLQRNPMDTCYAVYKQLFIDGYPFSYDLDELAQYFAAYSKLMDHWNEVMPGRICTINYEDLVSDFETQARRAVAFCGLDWQDQCLRFHENEQASATASTVQVRQRVYGSSVGKWKHFEQQLEPLRQALVDLEVLSD